MKITLLTVMAIAILASGCTTIEPQSLSLQNSSCSGIDNLRSTSGRQKAVIKFTNTSSASVSIFWVNYKGKEIHYKNLNEGEKFSLITYLSHPWIIRDNQEQCIGVFIPTKYSFEVKI